MYSFELPNPTYVEYVNDVARFLTIQFVIQFMYYVNDPDVSLFSADFILLMIYLILGISLYYLVFKKLVTFK